MSDVTAALETRAGDRSDLAWSRGQVGMSGLIASESAFFACFVVAYLLYLGRVRTGPGVEVLEVPWLATACLFASSATVAFALRALRGDRHHAFLAWWVLTIGLGAAFLVGTALEWYRLIVREGLTLSTNLLGTTFYSLVGFHAAHVMVGVLLLTVVAGIAQHTRLEPRDAGRVELVTWYWHFVDAVWVVVFTTVYWVGR
jgi:cytochrome c oxidase subunit 3/cytochrome o ubiquinol oxidase subunit 3